MCFFVHHDFVLGIVFHPKKLSSMGNKFFILKNERKFSSESYSSLDPFTTDKWGFIWKRFGLYVNVVLQFNLHRDYYWLDMEKDVRHQIRTKRIYKEKAAPLDSIQMGLHVRNCAVRQSKNAAVQRSSKIFWVLRVFLLLLVLL